VHVYTNSMLLLETWKVDAPIRGVITMIRTLLIATSMM
jgi:hypothetical protein